MRVGYYCRECGAVYEKKYAGCLLCGAPQLAEEHLAEHEVEEYHDFRRRVVQLEEVLG
jgi:predicted ATP-dependent serine protease